MWSSAGIDPWPLLFLVYVNDMAASTKCNVLLYADDSALMVSGKYISTIEMTLSSEVGSLHEWLVDNRLSLHFGKTESILFGSKRKLKKHDRLQIVCNGSDIESKKVVTYLGVTLDQHLSGEAIVDKIVSKCSNKVKFLYRKTRNFDLKTKKLLVSALIQCHFDYGCSSWYCGITQRNKGRLQSAQNKVLRFLLDASPRTHIGALEFSSLGLLPVEKRVEQLKLNHMFNVYHRVAPSYIISEFQPSNSTYETRRNTSTFILPSVKSFGINSLAYTGAKLWNMLPVSVKHTRGKHGFKKLVKEFLMSNVLSVYQNDFIYF